MIVVIFSLLISCVENASKS